MKFTILIAFLVFNILAAFAQDEDPIRVIKDSKIDFLVENQKRINMSKETEEGFRIQVVLANTRQETNTVKSRFYSDFPNLRTYITYDQPYYQLRVGDFKTRLEAMKYLDQIAHQYKSAYIVKDQINIKR